MCLIFVSCIYIKLIWLLPSSIYFGNEKDGLVEKPITKTKLIKHISFDPIVLFSD